MPRSFMICLLLSFSVFILVQIARGDDPQAVDSVWPIHGRVVDEQGQPVEDFVAARFWSANGVLWDQTGKIDPKRKSLETMGHEGEIAAFPECTAKNLGGGKFVLSVPSNAIDNSESDSHKVPIFVTDSQQKLGGFSAADWGDSKQTVTVTLRQLVHVSGKIYCWQTDSVSERSQVTAYFLVDDRTALRFSQCNSGHGEFSFLLPSGKYNFKVNASSPRSNGLKVSVDRQTSAAYSKVLTELNGVRIDVPAGHRNVDLGPLYVDWAENRLAYVGFYGKNPPELAVTAARGISDRVKLSDLHGKWVLLDFWGFSCQPCIKESLPELAQFYQEHQTERSQFEILSICWHEDIKSIDEYEKLEAPIADRLWKGERLPFPVLIDTAGQTAKAYGIIGLPSTFLIAPDGSLVKDGDLKMLADKLKVKP